jgi:hypothetical protein
MIAHSAESCGALARPPGVKGMHEGGEMREWAHFSAGGMGQARHSAWRRYGIGGYKFCVNVCNGLASRVPRKQGRFGLRRCFHFFHIMERPRSVRSHGPTPSNLTKRLDYGPLSHNVYVLCKAVTRDQTA